MFSAISCIYNTRRALSRAARRVRSHPRGLNPGVMPAMDSPDPGGLGEAELTEPLAALAPRGRRAERTCRVICDCRPPGSARRSSRSRWTDTVLGHDCHDLRGVPAGLGGGMQGVEVVLQPPGGDDEQAAGGTADTSKRVRPFPGEEHERTCGRLELFAVAFDLQPAGEQVDALVLAGVGMPGRAAVEREREDRELAARGPRAGLQVGLGLG